MLLTVAALSHSRRDCHGLPIEFEIDTKLGIKSKDDVMKMGVANYNAECRAIVQRYTTEWRSTVTRMGRWVDFDNDYKTMDLKFMESVWWVFSQLHAKGLVYRGYKVMPYSWACTTPLSNFEAGQNYKDVKDPTCCVAFPLLTDENTSFVAWTTTPWTLPSNLALAVNAQLDYVTLKDTATQKQYIVAQSRIEELYPAKKKVKGESAAAAAAASASADYTLISTVKGAALVGLEYSPPFSYFISQRQSHSAFRVIAADYVTSDSGTGVVHQAPAFGEEDYNALAAAGIIEKGAELVCPVDANGRFTDEVTHFKGRFVKEADKDIMRHLKEQGLLVKQGIIDHSYPFCWRSDTPLLYKAVPSWFISVEKIKDKLLACNDLTYWVPAFVKEKRFHNWLRDARDWAVSRSRYWGTPLPIWVSDDGKEIVVVSSVEELQRLTGVEGIVDLHKDKIDHLTMPSQQGRGTLKRVPEVFDCWFESGSMPYAQQHYPFENKERFEGGFPADFIAEGLDQTRGWFYTLMVISTALFDKPAFKNLIVNGLVLAEDGKKMSKRLKNYPDPLEIVTKYGADALRIYLINSPVVRAEPLRFSSTGVHDVIKSVLLPWFHAYRFCVENIQRYEVTNHTSFHMQSADSSVEPSSTNFMDQWIQSSLQTLVTFVRAEMQAYRLYTVVPRLLHFIEQLTNWYVRLNRTRMKGAAGPKDTHFALSTLTQVLLALCSLMAPVSPFFVEYIYQNLRLVLPAKSRLDSIHYTDIPLPQASLSLPAVEQAVARMQSIVELGRTARDKADLTLSTPAIQLIVVHKQKSWLTSAATVSEYVADELNVRTVEFSSDEANLHTRFRAEPQRRALGQRLGKKAPQIGQAVMALTHAQILDLQDTKQVELCGEMIALSEIDIIWEFCGDAQLYSAQGNGEVLVLLCKSQDRELLVDKWVRQATRAVQSLRKAASLVPSDEIDVFYRVLEQDKGTSASATTTPSKEQVTLQQALLAKGDWIAQTIGRPLVHASLQAPRTVLIAQSVSELTCNEAATRLELRLTRKSAAFDSAAMQALAKETGASDQQIALLQQHLQDRNYSQLCRQIAANPLLEVKLDGVQYKLKAGQHIFAHAHQLPCARQHPPQQ